MDITDDRDVDDEKGLILEEMLPTIPTTLYDNGDIIVYLFFTLNPNFRTFLYLILGIWIWYDFIGNNNNNNNVNIIDIMGRDRFAGQNWGQI